MKHDMIRRKRNITAPTLGEQERNTRNKNKTSPTKRRMKNQVSSNFCKDFSPATKQKSPTGQKGCMK